MSSSPAPGRFAWTGVRPRGRTAGGVVHVPSQLVHGITMDVEPMAILYVWRGGDLREKSTFV